jgi:hypothetical protein
MKVLLKQSGKTLEVVQIGAISTDALPTGTYLIAKVKETLVVRNGSGSVKNTDNTANTASTAEPFEQPKHVNFDPPDPDYSKPTNPINNFKVGSTIWIDGERFYVSAANAEPTRFPSAEEPLYVDGKLFNGTVSVKKSKDADEPGDNVYHWSAEKTIEAKKPAKEKKKKTDNQDYSDILSGKVSLEDLSKPEDDDDPFGLGPVKPKAKAKVKEEEFKDFDFLEDIGNAGKSKPAVKIPEKNETYMEGDLTIIIVKDGSKYRREFKTETSCKNAFNLIKGLIGNDENITQMLDKFTLITQ